MLLYILGTSAENWAIYNGAGDLNPWQSTKDIAGALIGIGFLIRAVVIFTNVIRSDSPDNLLKGVYSLIIGIVAVTIISNLL